MTAIDAVANLRALADVLEKHPDAQIRMSHGIVWFEDKESFMAVAKDFPRPAKKIYEEGQYGDLKLEHGELTKTGVITICIARSAVCNLKEPARPAVYECPSIFSPEEEAELEQA